MVTQSFEVSLLSFALPSTTMVLIHTFANNIGREQWQVVKGAISSPDNFLSRKPTSTNYISLERKFIGESGSFSVLTKCFGFAILFAIFAKLPKFGSLLGVRKNNKHMKHKHVMYHFTFHITFYISRNKLYILILQITHFKKIYNMAQI